MGEAKAIFFRKIPEDFFRNRAIDMLLNIVASHSSALCPLLNSIVVIIIFLIK